MLLNYLHLKQEVKVSERCYVLETHQNQRGRMKKNEYLKYHCKLTQHTCHIHRNMVTIDHAA